MRNARLGSRLRGTCTWSNTQERATEIRVLHGDVRSPAARKRSTDGPTPTPAIGRCRAPPPPARPRPHRRSRSPGKPGDAPLGLRARDGTATIATRAVRLPTSPAARRRPASRRRELVLRGAAPCAGRQRDRPSTRRERSEQSRAPRRATQRRRRDAPRAGAPRSDQWSRSAARRLGRVRTSRIGIDRDAIVGHMLVAGPVGSRSATHDCSRRRLRETRVFPGQIVEQRAVDIEDREVHEPMFGYEGGGLSNVWFCSSAQNETARAARIPQSAVGSNDSLERIRGRFS